MTAKHQSAEYQRNAALRRKQVAAAHRAGDAYPCWRGRGGILPRQPFDIGHINPLGGEGLDNLAPEHRHRTPGCCTGNRSEGGKIGAAITNRRARPEEKAAWKL